MQAQLFEYIKEHTFITLELPSFCTELTYNNCDESDYCTICMGVRVHI